jgi:hypothetical protein
MRSIGYGGGASAGTVFVAFPHPPRSAERVDLPRKRER